MQRIAVETDTKTYGVFEDYGKDFDFILSEIGRHFRKFKQGRGFPKSTIAAVKRVF